MEVNPQATRLTPYVDVALTGKAGELLPEMDRQGLVLFTEPEVHAGGIVGRNVLGF